MAYGADSQFSSSAGYVGRGPTNDVIDQNTITPFLPFATDAPQQPAGKEISVNGKKVKFNDIDFVKEFNLEEEVMLERKKKAMRNRYRLIFNRGFRFLERLHSLEGRESYNSDPEDLNSNNFPPKSKVNVEAANARWKAGLAEPANPKGVRSSVAALVQSNYGQTPSSVNSESLHTKNDNSNSCATVAP